MTPFSMYSIKTKDAARSSVVVPVRCSSKHSHHCPSLAQVLCQFWEKLLHRFKIGRKLTLRRVQIVFRWFYSQGQTSVPAGSWKGGAAGKAGTCSPFSNSQPASQWRCKMEIHLK